MKDIIENKIRDKEGITTNSKKIEINKINKNKRVKKEQQSTTRKFKNGANSIGSLNFNIRENAEIIFHYHMSILFSKLLSYIWICFLKNICTIQEYTVCW